MNCERTVAETFLSGCNISLKSHATHFQRTEEQTNSIHIRRIQELPTRLTIWMRWARERDRERCMLVGAIGTQNSDKSNSQQHWKVFLKVDFFSVGLPAAEVFILFSFYNVRYASVHNKNKTLYISTHKHAHAYTAAVTGRERDWEEMVCFWSFGYILVWILSWNWHLKSRAARKKQLNQTQSTRCWNSSQ